MANVLQIQMIRRKIENHFDGGQIAMMEAVGFYVGETDVRRIKPTFGGRDAFAATCEGSHFAVIVEWAEIGSEPYIDTTHADCV